MASDGSKKYKEKRPHASKPYDRPKTIINRVKDTVSHFLPQSWIPEWLKYEADSKPRREWLNQPSTSGYTLNKPRIPLNQTVTYDEFDASASDREVIDAFTPSVTPEPPPSSSTPVIPVKQLQSLTNTSALDSNSNAKLPSGVIDGVLAGDDKSVVSDTSVSTSGCSSMVPHVDKREYQKDVLGLNDASLNKLSKNLQKSIKTDSNRRRVQLAEADLGQQSEPDIRLSQSLFSETEERRTTFPQPGALASKRPRFNAPMFGSPIAQSLNKSLISENHTSPFYPGKTTYGGASAAHNTSLPSNSSPYQHVPYKTLSVKPSHTVNRTDGVMSATARRILSTLERISTPLSDVKRIPASGERRSLLDSASISSPSQQRRPGLGSGSARACGPPVNRLVTPSPARHARNYRLSGVKRKPEIPVCSDSTSKDTGPGDSKSVSKTLNTAPSYSSEHPPVEGGKNSGKMRTRITASHHYSSRLEEPEEESYALPEVALPIATLPEFTFGASSFATSSSNTSAKTLPIRQSVSDTTCNRTSHLNDTTSKKAMDDSACNKRTESEDSPKLSNIAQSVGVGRQFSFTSPIPLSQPSAADMPAASIQFDFAVPVGTNVTTPGNAPSKPQFNFVLAEGDHRIKRKSSDEGFSKGSAAKELKSGSVMDVLCGRSGSQHATTTIGFGEKFKPKTGSWECETCMVRNSDDTETCVACQSNRPEKQAVKSSEQPNQRASIGVWECALCKVKNEDKNEKCGSCAKPKPDSDVPSVTKSEQTSDPVIVNSWGNALKQTGDTWECSCCMIRNKNAIDKCVACESKRPGVPVSEPSRTSGWGDKFKPDSESWECDTCMVRNKGTVSKCLACETPKRSTPSNVNTGTFKFGSSSSPGSQSTFKFSVSSQAAKTDLKFGATKTNEQIKTNSASDKVGFKFGSTETEASAVKYGVTVTTGASAFKFGVTTSNADTAPASFKFGVSGSPPLLNVIKGTAADSASQKVTVGSSTLNGSPNFSFQKDSGTVNSDSITSNSERISITTAPLGSTTLKLKQPVSANDSELKTGSVMDVLVKGKQLTPHSHLNSETEKDSGLIKKEVSSKDNTIKETESSSDVSKNTGADKPAAFSFGSQPVSSGGFTFGLEKKQDIHEQSSQSVSPETEVKVPAVFQFGSSATSNGIGATDSKPPDTAPKLKKETPLSSLPTFSFGTPKPTSVTSGLVSSTVTATSSSPGLFSFGANKSTPGSYNNSSTGFSTTGSAFGVPASTPNPPTTTTFSFGSSSNVTALPSASVCNPVAQKATPESNALPSFNFDSSAAKSQQQGLFVFGSSATPASSASSSATTTNNISTFSFGSKQVESTANFSFGSTPAGSNHTPFGAATNTPGFTFNAPPSGGSVFGATPNSPASFTFGASSLVTPSTQQNTFQPQPQAVFTFGGSGQAPAAPQTTHGFSFNASAPPSFNFSSSQQPENPFSATGSGVAGRKMKRAVRRTTRK